MRVALAVLLLLIAAMIGGPVLAQDAPPEETIVGTAPPPDVTPAPIPRPNAASEISEDGVTVEYFFDAIRQGRAGVVRLSGTGVTGARVEFLGKMVDFFETEDGFYALLTASMEQAIREYDATFYAIMADGSRTVVPARIKVDSGGFIRQEVDLPSDRAYLIDPQVERSEFARLAAVFENTVKEKLWNGETFMLPIPSEITSSFGAVRVLNGTAETRHTGWDLRAAVGRPVMAAAAGRVAFAGRLDIRGNHVIIDHGFGIFTGYSHLSQVNVTRGQTLTRGQIIGLSGNSGRSSGPHLHWEVTVNGDWVDSVDFIKMWLPF